ncbi:MAG: D-alanine--D-alanine ligase [Flavobacteriaceae bacterium]|nr:D-alanine--D-alanine ligase [Flavobacteriaceae bacterium]
MHKLKAFFTRLFFWEHWPTFMFYIPLIPYYLVKAIRAGHPVYYLVVNPALKYSGNGTESKYKTLQLLPENYRPKSILVDPDTNFNSVTLLLSTAGIRFPLIAKPDIGFRGYLVKLVPDENALRTYLNNNKIAIILQEFINLPNECGVFYYRYPDADQGHITSITLKEFATLTGNGKDTLSNLILNDQRAYLYYPLFSNIHQKKMDSIPEYGEKVKLSSIGNHSKGTRFINGNHLIDSELEQTFDRLAKSIEGFYYGRFDLKYRSWEELKKGENFKILELNGIIAEPTHIYDPENASYFKAVQSIRHHWHLMNDIALLNNKKFDLPYPALKPYLKDMLWLRKYSKKITRLNKKN